MAVIELKKATFENEVKNAGKLVMIDFWATWCGPCRMMSPVVDMIAEERSDIKVCKVNVDDEPALAEKFNIMSIPTLVFINGDEVKGQIVGAHSKEDVLKVIDSLK